MYNCGEEKRRVRERKNEKGREEEKERERNIQSKWVRDGRWDGVSCFLAIKVINTTPPRKWWEWGLLG